MSQKTRHSIVTIISSTQPIFVYLRPGVY